MDLSKDLLDMESSHDADQSYSLKSIDGTDLPSLMTHNQSREDLGILQESRVQLSTDEEEAFRTSFLYNPVILSALIFGSVVLLSGTIAYTMYRRRKRYKESYEQVSEKGQAQIANGKAMDPVVYSYVCPNRSIDFVVPSIQTSLTSLPSPGDASMSSSTDTASWNKATLFDGASPLLGGINPELYKVIPEQLQEETVFPDGHLGRLWFGVEYDLSTERLLVRLIKAKNLPSRDRGSVNCCDPFVRMYLMPDERRFLQSKVKKKTCNPRFEETFIFQIPARTTDERILKFTVYDNDRGRRHNVIGHLLYPLKELSDTNETLLLWQDLQKEPDFQIPSDTGQLLVGLCYNQNLERLTVTVFEAKALRVPNGLTSVDSFVRASLIRNNKIIKSKKTMVAKDCREPQYNESFNFRLPQNSVNTANINLQVIAAIGGGQKDTSLGRVVLGSFMFCRGKALQHWNEAMSAGHRQIRYWHKLT